MAVEIEPLRYAVALGGHEHWARTVDGVEVINDLARFEVSFFLPTEDPFSELEAVGTEATLQLRRGSEVRREITLHVMESSRGSIRGTGTTEVRLVLEPRLARFRYRTDIRVFRDKTAPEIVSEVWKAAGIAVEQRLDRGYVKRGYCVQMRESDLDFGKRLLEDEGISWHVLDDGTALLVDSPTGYGEPVATLPYRDVAGVDQQEEAIVAFGTMGQVTPGKITLRDFNPEHPSLDMDVHARAPWSQGSEWYDYPGEYELPPEGSRKARLRAEALDWRYGRHLARSTSALVAVGARFALEGAPDGLEDGNYVPTRVVHHWRRELDSFVIELEAIDESVTARPWPTTPIPTLTNPVTGVVTGPGDEDIHTDVWGRVKVIFPWDRLSKRDGEDSDWIPVLQDNTGSSSSMSRTKWEVLCNFLEGDPDRPVVMGRVYNGEDVLPEKLPLNKTSTMLKSLSSPGRAGKNMVRFEDLAGEQQIFFFAEKDQNVVVANDKTERVDAGEGHRVEGHEVVAIGVDQKMKISGEAIQGTAVNLTESIGANRTRKVAEAESDQIGKNRVMTIGGSHLRKMGDTDSVNTVGSTRESVGGLILEASVKENRLTLGRLSAFVVGGAVIEIARLSKMETNNKLRAEAIGGLVMGKAKDRIAMRVGKKRTTLVGGSYTVDAVREIILNAFEKLEVKSSTGKLDAGTKLKLKVGSTEIVFGGGVIGMKADKSIVLTTTAANKQGSDKATQNPMG